MKSTKTITAIDTTGIDIKNIKKNIDAVPSVGDVNNDVGAVESIADAEVVMSDALLPAETTSGTDALFFPATDAVHAAITLFAERLAEEGYEVRGVVNRSARPREHWNITASEKPDTSLKENIEVPPSLAQETIVAQFEVPLTGNDGTPFGASTLAEVFWQIYLVDNGASFTRRLGFFREKLTAYIDQSITVEVWTRAEERLVDCVSKLRELLEQVEIRLRLQSGIRFVSVTEAGTCQVG